MTYSTSTTRPKVMPTATISSPNRDMLTGCRLVTNCMIALAATSIRPSITVTAATTDRTVASRAVLVVAVSERTA